MQRAVVLRILSIAAAGLAGYCMRSGPSRRVKDVRSVPQNKVVSPQKIKHPAQVQLVPILHYLRSCDHSVTILPQLYLRSTHFCYRKSDVLSQEVVNKLLDMSQDPDTSTHMPTIQHDVSLKSGVIYQASESWMYGQKIMHNAVPEVFGGGGGAPPVIPEIIPRVVEVGKKNTSNSKNNLLSTASEILKTSFRLSSEAVEKVINMFLWAIKTTPTNKAVRSMTQASEKGIEVLVQIVPEVSKEVVQIAPMIAEKVNDAMPEIEEEVDQIPPKSEEEVAQIPPKIVKRSAQLPAERDEVVQSPHTKPTAYTLPKTEENLQPTSHPSLQLPYTLPQTHPKPGQKTEEKDDTELLPLPGTPPVVNGEKVLEIGGVNRRSMAAFRAPNTPNTDPETPDEDSGLSEPARVGQNPPSIPSPLGPQQFLLAGASTGTEYGMMKESKKDHIERKKLKAERHEKRRLECVKKKGEKIRKKECLELSNISNRAGQEENRYMIRVCVAASAALCASLVAPTEPTTTQDLGARKPSEADTIPTTAAPSDADNESDRSGSSHIATIVTGLMHANLSIVGDAEVFATSKYTNEYGYCIERCVVLQRELERIKTQCTGALSGMMLVQDPNLIVVESSDKSNLLCAMTIDQCLRQANNGGDLTLARQLKLTLDPVSFARHCDDVGLLGRSKREFKECALLDDVERSYYESVLVELEDRSKRDIQLPTPLTQDQLPALLRPDTKK